MNPSPIVKSPLDIQGDVLHHPGMRITLFILAFLCLPWTAHAQARFAVELQFGQSAGLTSYLQNVVYLQDETIFLADEIAGSGLAFGVAFVFEQLELAIDARFFERSDIKLHHQGTEPFLLASVRTRPDGSVDDAGVTYRSISERQLAVPIRNRGDLFVTTLSGGYRWYIVEGDFDLFVPMSGGLAITHVFEQAQPYAFGLQVSTGMTAAFDIASPVSFFVSGRLHGLLTPTYGSQDDAARSSATVGQGTMGAAVSTLVYSSLNIGFQVAIR